MTVFDYSMIAMATAVISLVIFMAVMVIKHERRERRRRARETVWARRDAEAMQHIQEQ
jgi:large-conductance mechanosensitive channel